MYTTYIIYAFCLILLFWGGKFAGFGKEKFHEDYFSLDVSKSLRGLAAFGVLLHHISQEDAFQNINMMKGWGVPGELSIFVNYGFKFVAIFFFCSGFGLIKSLKTKENYFDCFLKKRVVKTIVIPFYVNVLLYAIWHVIIGDKMPAAHWILNFTGLTLMNDYAWFPVVLTIFYVAFYFIFKNIKNRKVCFALMFLVIFLQGVTFCILGHRAWWAGPENWWLNPAYQPKWWMQDKIIPFYGEWWVNSGIAFLVGLIFAEYEEKIVNWFKKKYALKFILVLFVFLLTSILNTYVNNKFGYWTEYNKKGMEGMKKFITYCGQIPYVCMYVIVIFTIMLKYHVSNPVTRFFGNISFETYMMNLIAITTFRFLIPVNEWGMPKIVPGHWNLGLYAACVLAFTILLAFIFKWCNKQANKLIK